MRIGVLRGHRSQTEILGFAMVVLLVSVGLLFFIYFVATSQGSDLKKVFTDKQLAVNMNDALLSSTSGCKGLEFERLIIDCAGSASYSCSVGVNSCDYLQSSLQNVFDKTLDVWGKEYRYQIYFQGEPPLVDISNGACSGELEPGIFYLPVQGRTVFVRLDICG